MQINEKQLAQVNNQIKRLIAADNFYGKRLKEAGIDHVESVEDFLNLPFSEKQDLREAYPLGLMTCKEDEVVRIHSSSGTTGMPVIIPYTAKDVDDWGEMFKRCYEFAGITKEDRIHITPGYGLWTAGIGFQNGCEKLGAMAIPMGPGNTEKQLQMMMDLKSTVLCATSSYALLLAEEIEKRGIADKIHLKKGVIGSERWGEKMRKRISTELGIELYDAQLLARFTPEGFFGRFAVVDVTAYGRVPLAWLNVFPLRPFLQVEGTLGIEHVQVDHRMKQHGASVTLAA